MYFIVVNKFINGREDPKEVYINVQHIVSLEEESAGKRSSTIIKLSTVVNGDPDRLHVKETVKEVHDKIVRTRSAAK